MECVCSFNFFLKSNFKIKHTNKYLKKPENSNKYNSKSVKY